mmetsp:Transcript_15329/g.48309  ORF Transcript_15329/g.48309 Transcript_15329/m.48309 type:complete len:187 (-) Transcript_15329:184-744(-)
MTISGKEDEPQERALAAAAEEAAAASGEEAEIVNVPEILFVCKEALKECREKLKTGGDIDKALAAKLVSSELPDEEIMVPVDMRGVGDELDVGIEDMVEKLGAKRTAECLVKCAEYFEANKDNDPEEERPPEMTAAEVREAMFSDDESLEGEEEEEEELEEDELDEDEDEEGEEGGPPAKKAKTAA